MNQSQKTEIPDNEILFKYAYPGAFPPGQIEIPTSIFNDKDLSCDWEKYRKDPAKSFHVAEGKTRIISIRVCDDIRNPKNPKRIGETVPEWHQEIIHDPVSALVDPTHGENYSHSLIKGKKKKAVCAALVDNSEWHDL